jgi:hypothetical protein
MGSSEFDILDRPVHSNYGLYGPLENDGVSYSSLNGIRNNKEKK